MNIFLDENEINETEALEGDIEADRSCPICLLDYDGRLVRL